MTMTKEILESNNNEKATTTLAKKKRRHRRWKRRVTRLQKKRRIPWVISQGFKLLANYAPLTFKSFDLGKVKRRMLSRVKCRQLHSLVRLLRLSTIPISMKFHIFREAQHIFYLIYKWDTEKILSDWYVWYRWYVGTLDSCHLGAIVHAHLLNWYMCCKQMKLGLIVEKDNFAVVCNPTSFEVGGRYHCKICMWIFH